MPWLCSLIWIWLLRLGPNLSLTSCVGLGKLFNPSELGFCFVFFSVKHEDNLYISQVLLALAFHLSEEFPPLGSQSETEPLYSVSAPWYKSPAKGLQKFCTSFENEQTTQSKCFIKGQV